MLYMTSITVLYYRIMHSALLSAISFIEHKTQTLAYLKSTPSILRHSFYFFFSQVVILQDKLEERDAEIERLKLELEKRNEVKKIDPAPVVTDEPVSTEAEDVPQTDLEQI